MALEEAAALKDGKVPTLLTSLLEDLKDEKKASLAVADIKLGTAISNLPQFNITPVTGSNTMDIFRGLREHLPSLIPGLTQENIDRMALGLSHSISRHKLKFSVNKIDSMIIQAVRLLDDMDKDLNVFAMRTKEWYGWHFPELAKILNDNLAYARLVLLAGFRTNIAETDLSEVLPEDTEEAVKKAAEISMGTEITEDDLSNIKSLAEQVIRYTEYRAQLSSYLESRMRAIAPNLTVLLGYLIGARLIAHSGSLMSLAKAPGSTIQILGAEKALFRALKTKHDTPKYGIIYHSSLIGQASGRNKGKIARGLASKTALGLRVDALANDDEDDEEQRSILGVSSRIKLENRLRTLEGRALLPRVVTVGPSGEITTPGQFTLKETRRYNVDADGVGDSATIEAPNTLNGKKSKDGKKALIEVVEDQADEEMGDAKDDATDDDDEDEKASTPAKPKLSSTEYERLAKLAGLSAKKFKRKYERGDVQLNAAGTPKVYSKKELKKMRKAGENETPVKRPETPTKPEPSEKKKKRKAGEIETPVQKLETPSQPEPSSEKKKKRKAEENETPVKKAESPCKSEPSSEKKKKKRKHVEVEEEAAETKKDKKQKKKKRHSEA